MDFVEASMTFRAKSPITVLTATDSVRSLYGVEVPCALMYCTSSGPMPASLSAARIARTAPPPSGVGVVM